MMKRLQSISSSYETFSHRGKFNSILEERLHDGPHHHIMSITIAKENYDLLGNPTSAGALQFGERSTQQ